MLYECVRFKHFLDRQGWTLLLNSRAEPLPRSQEDVHSRYGPAMVTCRSFVLLLLVLDASWLFYFGNQVPAVAAAAVRLGHLGKQEREAAHQAGNVTNEKPHNNYPASMGKGCPDRCNQRGRCVDGKCVCAVVWSGDACETARRLPCAQETVPFTGWVFNNATLEEDVERYKDQICDDGEWTDLVNGKHTTYDVDDCKQDLVKLMREQLMLPPVDPIMSLLGATCAVVGSSDHMLGCSAGSEIDGHDVVIRLNDAPTVGHERDVGSRTTLRFQGAARMTFREGDEWTINLSYAYLFVGGGRNLLTYPEIGGHHGYYTDHPGPTHLQLSYGWKTIHAALHICSSVTLYGFTAVGNETGKDNKTDVGPTNGFGHYYQKWFDGKRYARYVWKQLGKPNMWKGWHDLRKWWLMGDRTHVRKKFTELANRNTTLLAFRKSPDNRKAGRMVSAGPEDVVSGCRNAWTNHCIDDEGRCTSELPSMLPNVKVNTKCVGGGPGNGM
eukprot:jgi/Mesvir1/21775/Mv04174-RA.1